MWMGELACRHCISTLKGQVAIYGILSEVDLHAIFLKVLYLD